MLNTIILYYNRVKFTIEKIKILNYEYKFKTKGEFIIMAKTILRGSSVSKGVGIGGVYVCKTPEVKINKDNVPKEKIDGEIINLEVAVCKTYIEIYDLYCGCSEDLNDEEKRILDVYNAILDDVYFFEEIKSAILDELITAQYAIYKCVQRYIDAIFQSDNEYAKQRIVDLNDIRNRLMKNIYENNDVVNIDNINSSHIVFVKELNPTLAVSIGKRKVQGVVAGEGAGFLSHAAIILRGFGIPTINSTEFEGIEKHAESIAVIDGFEGTVIIEPDDPEIDKYREMFRLDALQKKEFDIDKDIPVETQDKYKVGLSANISNITDFRAVKNKNIDGIGLVRTETLFIQNKKIPTEMRQTMVYSGFARGLKKGSVIIRTFDIGDDKVPEMQGAKTNWKIDSGRGIRWSLCHLDEFRIQLRAILKASMYGNVMVSLPMVETADEVIRARQILSEELHGLKSKGYTNVKNIKLGAVVETKQSVDNIDEILEHVDFVSIGTNDLLNGVMSLSRRKLGNEIREYFEPKFLKALDTVVSRSKNKDILVSVCGEMASDPLGAAVLIGLGVDDLSVAPACLSYIKRTIKDLYFEVARELVSRILECDNINEVIKILSGFEDCRF